MKSPEPVRHIAATLGVDARETLVVGDYRFDVDAGRAAGATTVYLSHGSNPDDVEADLVIEGMTELVDLLDRRRLRHRLWPPRIGVRAGLIILWLLLGLVLWWVFFARTEAIPSSIRLWLVLLVLAAAMWLTVTIARFVVRSWLTRPELNILNARPCLGETVTFDVRLHARRRVTVDRVLAVLSCTEEVRRSRRDEKVLPVVVARTESEAAEQVRLERDTPTDLACAITVPPDGMQSFESHHVAVRWQLDVLVFLGGRLAYRVTEALSVQPVRVEPGEDVS